MPEEIKEDAIGVEVPAEEPVESTDEVVETPVEVAQ